MTYEDILRLPPGEYALLDHDYDTFLLAIPPGMRFCDGGDKREHLYFAGSGVKVVQHVRSPDVVGASLAAKVVADLKNRYWNDRYKHVEAFAEAHFTIEKAWLELQEDV